MPRTRRARRPQGSPTEEPQVAKQEQRPSDEDLAANCIQDLTTLGDLLQTLHGLDGQATSIEAVLDQIRAVLERLPQDAESLAQARAALRYLRQKIDGLRTDVSTCTTARSEMQLAEWSDFEYAYAAVGGSPVSEPCRSS